MAQYEQLNDLYESVPSSVTYLAVAVAGLAGATTAARRGFDVVGVFGLAFATGLGGILLRDLMLGDIRQNLLTEPWYLLTAFGVATVGFFFAGLIARFDAIMLILDGLAMGFLCSIGAEAAIVARLPWSSAVLLGVLTAVGGLILRDVLAGTAPSIVRPGAFVAVPAIIASLVFVVMVESKLTPLSAMIVAMAISLFLRGGAYWFGWHTGSAAEFSDRVWNSWSRNRPHLRSDPGPLTYTDMLNQHEEPGGDEDAN